MLVFASKHQAGPADDCGVCRVAGGWAREPGRGARQQKGCASAWGIHKYVCVCLRTCKVVGVCLH